VVPVVGEKEINQHGPACFSPPLLLRAACAQSKAVQSCSKLARWDLSPPRVAARRLYAWGT
jgi:hypothetical protein